MSSLASAADGTRPAQDSEELRFDGRVALLTNFLPPYRIKVLQLLSRSVSQLRIFLSVAMEANRTWQPDWSALDVVVQKNLALPSRAKHARQHEEANTVHVPIDTLPQLARYRPDALISGEFGMRTVQAAVYRLFQPRVKLIIWATLSEVTEGSRGRERYWLRKLLLQCADAVMVNGASGRRYIAGLGYPAGKIHVVPQAIDNALFLGPAVRPEDSVLKLLTVGQLVERKGLGPFHEHLCAWCVAHPERRIEWTIIGSGPLDGAIRSWSQPANLTINRIGNLSYNELPAQYHRADLFVFPTLADEWGLVVNEAMSAGLPVLGSLYSQAVEDLVVDGGNGWTFRPDAPDEVSSALDRALNCSIEERNAMRSSAIKTVQAIDSLQMKNAILGALKSVASLNQPVAK